MGGGSAGARRHAASRRGQGWQAGAAAMRAGASCPTGRAPWRVPGGCAGVCPGAGGLARFDGAGRGGRRVAGFSPEPGGRDPRHAPAGSPLALGQIESTTYRRNQLLRDSDWASMDHSVELRTPLVDAWLLREVQPCCWAPSASSPASGCSPRPRPRPLPEALINRSKTGFGIPVQTWLKQMGKGGCEALAPAMRGRVRWRAIMNRLSVVHVVAGLHPSAGGPSRTVVQLTDALASHPEIDVTLLTQGFIGEPSVPSGGNVNSAHDRIAVASRVAFWPASASRTDTIGPANPSTNPQSWALDAGQPLGRQLARRNGMPLVVQPRGMLEPWALNHKALKKKIAMALFQRRDLESAKLFIATAAMEYESIRALGLRQPVAVIPNGVLFGSAAGSGDAAVAPLPKRPDRTALFLSRVHPKKGILNLLHAWATVAPQGWRLQIAGPDEGGHLAEVMALARKLGIDHAVEYLGELAWRSQSAGLPGRRPVRAAHL